MTNADIITIILLFAYGASYIAYEIYVLRAKYKERQKGERKCSNERQRYN